MIMIMIIIIKIMMMFMMLMVASMCFDMLRILFKELRCIIDGYWRKQMRSPHPFSSIAIVWWWFWSRSWWEIWWWWWWCWWEWFKGWRCIIHGYWSWCTRAPETLQCAIQPWGNKYSFQLKNILQCKLKIFSLVQCHWCHWNKNQQFFLKAPCCCSWW